MGTGGAESTQHARLMSFLGNMPFLSRNSRASASYDPAREPVQSEPEPEPEPELDTKSMAERMLEERGQGPSVASALSKVLPWKSDVSAEEQAEAVKSKLSYNVKNDRILLLCMAIEDEKATLVQQRWRAKMSNRDYWLRHRAASKLQAVMRGRLARRDHLPDHKAPTPNGQFFTRNSAPAAPRCNPLAPPPAPAP